MRKDRLKWVILLFVTLSGCVTIETVYTSNGDEVPWGSNVIYILTEDSKEDAFKNIGAILQRGGYGIEQSDEEIGAITSTLKKLDGYSLLGGNTHVQLFVSVFEESPTRVQVRGEYTTAEPGESANRGLMSTVHIAEIDPKVPVRRAWAEMQSVAERYEKGLFEFDEL